MASWTTRIGLIVPDVNVVGEPEICRMIPSDVSVHVSRATYDFFKQDPLAGLLDDIPRCAAELYKAKVHCVGFLCTGASFYRGYGSDMDIAAQIESIAKVKSTTASTAVINSFARLGIRSIALATPYDDWVNEKEVQFIQDNGFCVVSVAGLGVRDGGKIQDFSLDDAREIALRADNAESDALFISCTNFETFKIMRELRDALSKPVLSSNLCTIWELLCLVGHEKGKSYEEVLSLL